MLILPVLLLMIGQNPKIPPEANSTIDQATGWTAWGWKLATLLLLPFAVAGLLATSLVAYILFRVRRQSRDFVRIEQLAMNGEVAAAIKHLQDILKLSGHDIANTGNSKAVNYMAALEGMNGQWDSALKLIQRLELDFRSETLFLANKALILWKLGHLTDAEVCLRDHLRLTPDDVIPVCALGLFLAESNKISEATESLHLADQKYVERTNWSASRRQTADMVLESLRSIVRDSSHSNSNSDVPISPRIDKAIRAMLISNASGISFIEWNTKPQTLAIPPA